MADRPPTVVEVPLRRDYRFMYECFVIATQHEVYLLLEKSGDAVDSLRFDFTVFKFGTPNDEARGGHPLSAHGLGFYGLFEVKNSPWVSELMRANRVHPSHHDSLFSIRRHFVACLKDVMLEVVCDEVQEVRLSVEEVAALVAGQLRSLGA